MHPYQGLIAQATVVAFLLVLRPATAQIPAGPPRQPGGLSEDVITGVEYDRLNQASAVQRLPFVEAKLRRDAARGRTAAAGRDARWADYIRYRIAVDDWLIRQNSLQDPGYYPCRTDPVSLAALAQAASPSSFELPRQIGSSLDSPRPLASGAAPPTPMTLITVVNTEPAGDPVAFSIGGNSYQIAAGSRQNLSVPPNSAISFDGGGTIGPRQYTLSAGIYEFRGTNDGRVLYRLPNKP